MPATWQCSPRPTSAGRSESCNRMCKLQTQMMNPASKGMKLGGPPAEVGLCPMPKGPKSSIGDWAHHHPVTVVKAGDTRSTPAGSFTPFVRQFGAVIYDLCCRPHL